jgi:hypothetical protein
VTNKDGNTTTYTYADALNRLSQAQTKSAGGMVTDTRSYTFDGNSNRTSQTVNGTTTNYTYNAANELIQAGSATYTYDLAGQQKTSSAGLEMTYNKKAQMASIKPPGGPTKSFTFIGPGQAVPVQIGSTSLSSSTLGVAQETGAGTTTYTRDPNGLLVEEQVGGFTLYPVWDANGSMIGLTSSLDGSVIQTANYDPFGAITSQSGPLNDQPCQFQCASGARTDSTTGMVQSGSGGMGGGGFQSGSGGMGGGGFYNPDTATFTQSDDSDTPAGFMATINAFTSELSQATESFTPPRERWQCLRCNPVVLLCFIGCLRGQGDI